MLLAHKVELRPTAEQRDYLDRACGHRSTVIRDSKNVITKIVLHFVKLKNLILITISYALRN